MKLSGAAEIFANNLQSANIDNVLVSLRAIVDDSPFANRYKKMEQNLAALQEAEKVIVGIWAHWIGDPTADDYYRPHKKTRAYIKDIHEDLESFLVILLKKYWSTLGSSVRSKNIRKIYYSSNIGHCDV
jgi:hypothetical protein